MASFYPHEYAENLIEQLGIDLEQILTKSGTIRQAQLKLLNQLSYILDFDLPVVNIVNDLSRRGVKVGSIDDLKDVAGISIAQASMRLQNAATFAIMTKTVYNPKIIAEKSRVKWLPSHADEPRLDHQMHYGKTYTIEKAKDLGLAVDYGCKCGMDFKAGDSKQLEAEIKKIQKRGGIK